MKEKAEELMPRLLLGDAFIAIIDQIDDRKVAEEIADHLWTGIDRDTMTADDLERKDVIDRLVAARVIRPDDDPYADINNDVLADAYRVGYRDANNK